MNKKIYGVGSLLLFGVMVGMNFFRVTEFDRMTSTLWFGTIFMATLFLVGMYLITREEE